MTNKFKILDNGLLINKVSKTYGNKQVVRDISISINRREVVGLLGPNGAGKTTTFYIIVGLVKPDSGSIIYDKLDISNLPIYLRGKLGISYLPQEASIFRGMNVEDNLMSIIEIIEKDKSQHSIILENLLNDFNELQESNTTSHKDIELLLRSNCEKLGLKLRDYLGLVRNCVTGSEVSPPLFESIEILGLEECISRIQDCINTL